MDQERPALLPAQPSTSGSTPWPRSTTLFLLLVGFALAALSFVAVMSMPQLPLDEADDSALRSSYSAHHGIADADHRGDPATATAPWTQSTSAANGVPGVFMLANLMGHITQASSPYPGLALAQAILVALPLLWLPLSVARVFRRARAGYALILLPPLMWLLNNGTILVGTQYGLSDVVSVLRVPSNTGLVGSMVFLSLTVALLLSTYRMPQSRALAATALLFTLSVATGLFGWLAGAAVAAVAGVVAGLNAPRRWRWVVAVAVGALAIGVAQAVHSAFLAFAPTPAAVDTWAGGETYLADLLFVLKQFGAMIIFVLVGLVLAGTRRAPQRRQLTASFLVAGPALVIGLAYPVLTAPSLYNYAILSAALGYLTAIALGALVWSITSMPSHVRSVERNRLSGRSIAVQWEDRPAAGEGGKALSVIVPTRNGVDVLEDTLNSLGVELSDQDEIVVVENGSTDGTPEFLRGIQSQWKHPASLVLWHSPPGLGEALRMGVLVSRGERLLLTADDLPFGFSDLEGFRSLPPNVPVAIGSKAHPQSQVSRSTLRTIQSRIFRFLRAALLQSHVGDSQGTLWVQGGWGRAFGHLSRESGLMWTTELVLAAEQQQLAVVEVPVVLAERHETGSSRFRFGDAWRSVVGFARLAIYKDDYCNEDWVSSTRPEHDDEQLAPSH